MVNPWIVCHLVHCNVKTTKQNTKMAEMKKMNIHIEYERIILLQKTCWTSTVCLYMALLYYGTVMVGYL